MSSSVDISIAKVSGCTSSCAGDLSRACGGPGGKLSLYRVLSLPANADDDMCSIFIKRKRGRGGSW